MGHRAVRFRSWATLRRRDIGVAAALGVPSIWIAIDAQWRSPWIQGIELSIAGNLVGALVILYFAEPLIREAREAQVEVVPGIDLPGLIDAIKVSRYPVRILETGTPLLRDANRDAFLAALREVLHRQVQVQILLLDPESEGATQRDRELAGEGLQAEMRRHLRYMAQFTSEIGSLSNFLEVRLCTTMPSLQIYQSGLHCYVAVFLAGMLSERGPQLRTRLSTSLGDYASKYFDFIWAHEASYGLRRHLTAKVIVDQKDTTPLEFVAEFLIVDTCFYLSHDELDDLLDSFDDVVPARIVRMATQTVELRRIRALDLPPAVREISEQKYGPGRSYKVRADIVVL